ncbi:hypothetical protein HanOQP8_Chr10g0348301 [Helianthus annuus]|nr:hypothetical protein HanOQP8_Chr10g0348301 [Helianthus annuus]
MIPRMTKRRDHRKPYYPTVARPLLHNGFSPQPLPKMKTRTRGCVLTFSEPNAHRRVRFVLSL